MLIVAALASSSSSIFSTRTAIFAVRLTSTGALPTFTAAAWQNNTLLLDHTHSIPAIIVTHHVHSQQSAQIDQEVVYQTQVHVVSVAVEQSESCVGVVFVGDEDRRNEKFRGSFDPKVLLMRKERCRGGWGVEEDMGNNAVSHFIYFCRCLDFFFGVVLSDRRLRQLSLLDEIEFVFIKQIRRDLTPLLRLKSQNLIPVR
mmetsp:Transcript_3002/g.5673  ORF Transcript_3002/g.5673 Transcript_3002/m.5673 type:complete len:200 (-) Transcript_3002:450-1049(-)